jgi:hypothetical protein
MGGGADCVLFIYFRKCMTYKSGMILINSSEIMIDVATKTTCSNRYSADNCHEYNNTAIHIDQIACVL